MEASASIGARPAIESGVAVFVVEGALLRVAQDLIGLPQLLEFLFGRLVARILVWMIFQRELAVSLLDFLRLGTALDAQHFIAVTFGHGCQAAGCLATTTPAGRRSRSRNLYPLRSCWTTWPSGTSDVSFCIRASWRFGSNGLPSASSSSRPASMSTFLDRKSAPYREMLD